MQIVGSNRGNNLLLCVSSERVFCIGLPSVLLSEHISTLDPKQLPLLGFTLTIQVLFSEKGVRMLWTIFAILLILWLLGWGFHVAGSLIHLLLVVALVVLVINLITGRRVVD